MTRYHIGLAGHDDDAEIRAVLSRTPMMGRISVTFRREPDFFAASVVEGRFRQVVVGRTKDHQLAGLGMRSIDRRFVNGLTESVGYLSGLRLLPEHRNGVLLARGLQFLRELCSDDRAHVYLTTISKDNHQAIRTFLSRHRGLPAFQPIGSFHTLALAPGRAKVAATLSHGASLRRGTLEDIPLVLDFLRQQGPRRQFFPDYDDMDFGEQGRLRGLKPESLHLAFRRGRLVGMLGTWDQTEFRQTVVQDYSSPLRWVRPLYNVVAPIIRFPRLPPAGSQIRSAFAALPVIAEDDLDVLYDLVQALQDDAADLNADGAFLGLHESDPLWRIVHRFRGVLYTTRLFMVYWQDGEAEAARMDDRVPYLELGSL